MFHGLSGCLLPGDTTPSEEVFLPRDPDELEEAKIFITRNVLSRFAGICSLLSGCVQFV